jgi:hypothetical protein
MAKDFNLTLDDYHYHQAHYVGICTICGAERDCTEPDAENYPCEECGEYAVSGSDILLINDMYDSAEED